MLTSLFEFTEMLKGRTEGCQSFDLKDLLQMNPQAIKESSDLVFGEMRREMINLIEYKKATEKQEAQQKEIDSQKQAMSDLEKKLKAEVEAGKKTMEKAELERANANKKLEAMQGDLQKNKDEFAKLKSENAKIAADAEKRIKDIERRNNSKIEELEKKLEKARDRGDRDNIVFLPPPMLMGRPGFPPMFGRPF